MNVEVWELHHLLEENLYIFFDGPKVKHLIKKHLRRPVLEFLEETLTRTFQMELFFAEREQMF